MCRTTHVVDVLPERVRLVAAPGDLHDVELVVQGWRTEGGETALICRLVDGSSGTIPARWTDLPSRGVAEPRLGTVATPEAWRSWGERLAGLLERCPSRGRASSGNGGGDVCVPMSRSVTRSSECSAFPAMSSSMAPHVRRCLVRHVGDRYVAPPHWRALMMVFCTPRFYDGHDRLIEPWSGRRKEILQVERDLRPTRPPRQR